MLTYRRKLFAVASDGLIKRTPGQAVNQPADLGCLGAQQACRRGGHPQRQFGPRRLPQASRISPAPKSLCMGLIPGFRLYPRPTHPLAPLARCAHRQA